QQAKARTSYEAAAKLLADVAEERPSDLLIRDQLAETWRDESQALVLLGALDNAMNRLMKSRKLGEELRQADPEAIRFRRTVALARLDESAVQHTLGDWATSLLTAQQCFSLMTEIIDAKRDAHRLDGMFRGAACNRWAVALREQTDYPAALKQHARAVSMQVE